MKKLVANGLIITIAIPFLAACSGSVRDTLGMRRSAPNEFKVVSNPPLSVPPEFSLRPPVPDDSFVENKSTSTEAKKVLFEKASADITISSETNGEEAFRSLFNANEANPEIKSLLQKEIIEAAKQEEEKSFIEKNLLSKIPSFSKDNEKQESDSIVDAKLEKDRITESKNKGEEITGNQTPVVEQGSSNNKNGLFNKILGL